MKFDDEERSAGNKYRLIVENARTFGVFTTDLQRNITTWNISAERLLGFRAEEMIGRLSDVIFTAEDCAAFAPEREMDAAETMGRAANARWHQRKDGTQFWGNGSMVLMKDGDEAIGYLKILHDQTREREAEDDLERSQDALREALQKCEQERLRAEATVQIQEHFITAISHELRTPLTPVLLALGTLLSDPEVPEQYHEALKMIRHNVEIETHFIEELLDVSWNVRNADA